MQPRTQIDPVVSFRNSQQEQARGTIVKIQRESLVMEVYNPHSIVQVSEVISELNIRRGSTTVYNGRAVIISMVNTGLTAVISVTLIDGWRELSQPFESAGAVGVEAQNFVREWSGRPRIGHNYQIAVNEGREFLSEASRWAEQVDLSDNLPKESGRLRADIFDELAYPIMLKTKEYFDRIEAEASQVPTEHSAAHRAFAQAALHPFLLRSPFVFRTYTKPLGYAGDYQMVNQILHDPRQGPTTYFQIINTAFLHTAVVVAHRNRIDLLVDFLTRTADAAQAAGRPFRIMNVGCGPAQEIQRFLQTYPRPDMLSFELVDFSQETLDWTRQTLEGINSGLAHPARIDFVHNSVHDLLKRRIDPDDDSERNLDAVYCAGLFDYLSDKVCNRLMRHFASRTRMGGKLFITNVHTSNPEKFSMEHILEWYLIYRDESTMHTIVPKQYDVGSIFRDPSGVNVFAEASLARTEWQQ